MASASLSSASSSTEKKRARSLLADEVEVLSSDDNNDIINRDTKKSKKEPPVVEEASALLLVELERCERELHSTRLIHGDDSPKLAETLSTLGLYHQHMLRNHDKAMMYHCESLRILNNEINKNEHNNDNASSSSSSSKIAMGVALTDVAQIHEARAKNERALYTYREALNLFTSIPNLPHSDPRIFSTKQGIDRLCRCSAGVNQDDCTCYQSNDNSDDSDPLMKKIAAAASTSSHDGENVEEIIESNLYHSRTTEQLLTLGDDAMTSKKYELASQYYRQAALKTPAIAITYYSYFNPNSGSVAKAAAAVASSAVASSAASANKLSPSKTTTTTTTQTAAAALLSFQK